MENQINPQRTTVHGEVHKNFDGAPPAREGGGDQNQPIIRSTDRIKSPSSQEGPQKPLSKAAEITQGMQGFSLGPDGLKENAKKQLHVIEDEIRSKVQNPNDGGRAINLADYLRLGGTPEGLKALGVPADAILRTLANMTPKK